MSGESKHFYEFGPFRLDPAERLLLRHDGPVSLPPKAFATLVLLVERGGHLFGKEELIRAVWPETFVEENNLTQCISTLRKALGEDVDGRSYIETVPKLGYRFVADVREVGVQQGDVLLAKHTKAHIVIREQEEHDVSAQGDTVTAHAGIARRWKGLAAFSAVAVLLAAGLTLYSRQPATLTERDQILLGDFENSTGEPVFDETLKQALTIKLEESAFLNIVSKQRVRETLGLMGRSADERLTQPIAQEICRRQSVKAAVSGSIARLGSHYILALDATNCLTGETLGREQVDAGSREEVLPVLGKASTALRRKLGESLASIQQLDTPIVEAETSSLEALRAFTLGQARFAHGAPTEAIPFFEQAIELDPNFTLPYDGLAAVYYGLGEIGKATQNKKKEFELRQHASQRQRFGITVTYYHMVTGEIDKADAAYQVYEQTYSREVAPHVNRAALSNDSGQFDRALQEGREAIRLGPRVAIAYSVAGWGALRMNHVEEAKAIFDAAVAQKLDSALIHRGLYAVAFLQGDPSAMDREVLLSSGSSDEFRIVMFEAQAEAFAGKLRNSREFYERAAELARKNHFADAAAAILAGRALVEASLGNGRQAHELALRSLGVAHGRDGLGIAASALALSGDLKRAQECIDELARTYPSDTLVNAVALPSARAAMQIQSRNAAKAIQTLQDAKPYEFGPFVFGQGYLAGYLRGQAYLRSDNWTKAAEEFQNILDHPAAAPFAPLQALAHLGLARALASGGHSDKSRQAYERFFSLWKGADPDIPVLKLARAEYASLMAKKEKRMGI